MELEDAEPLMDVPLKEAVAKKSSIQDNKSKKSASVTWGADSDKTRKRKAVPVPQQEVKCRLLEMAEIEHVQKMKILKLKEEIVVLKKEKLLRELGLTSNDHVSAATCISGPSVNYTPPVPNTGLSPSTSGIFREAGSDSPICQLWQPYDCSK